ncbi:MAG TPA: MarR family transcriptional regulator [Pseudonocardia sp.]|nr:MarR family transcriptional regulator [Pseudonocardia sp.]
MPSEHELAVADGVGSAMIRLVRLIERKRDRYQAENPSAVERAAYHLLAHLVLDGPRRASALAEAVHSDPSTISRQIAGLVKLGYVERTADPDDGRATQLAATAEGRRVFEENRQARNHNLAELLAGWSEEDRLALRDLLGRFAGDLENLDRLRHPLPPPPGDRLPTR